MRMAAAGTKMDLKVLNRNVPIEAYNLSTAIVDSDSRLSDDELWPLISTFSQFDMIPPTSTPAEIRNEGALKGRKDWLLKPSEMFELLAGVDGMRGTQLAQTYYDEAMKLAHMVGSLDRFPSDAELKAIVAFQRLLRENMPGAGATASATGGPAASAQAKAEGKTLRYIFKRLCPLQYLVGKAEADIEQHRTEHRRNGTRSPLVFHRSLRLSYQFLLVLS